MISDADTAFYTPMSMLSKDISESSTLVGKLNFLWLEAISQKTSKRV